MVTSDPLIGKSVGVYKILGQVGKGGMGVVYMAKDMALGRMAALKFLPAALAEDPQMVERFGREARAAASLNHPNIVTIYGTGRHETGYFIAMELVEGESLTALMKEEGRFDPKKALEIIGQVTDALVASHAHQIVHRDIKPENIMVDASGRVRVMDFGLAWAGFETTRLTSTGMTMGTPQYMSPEQWADSRVDERSDIYSLGVVFFEMLAGRLPFGANTPVGLMRKVVDQPAPSLSEVGVEVAWGLSEIVNKMLAKKPEDRFASAAALREQLGHFSEELAQADRGLSGFSAPGSELLLERFDHESEELKQASLARIEHTVEARQAHEQESPVQHRRRFVLAGLAAGVLAAAAVWLLYGVASRNGLYASVFLDEDFVWIAPGTFDMGSPENEAGRKDDEIRHPVTLTNGFWMSKYEVTQQQWAVVMGENPSFLRGEDRPIENVSWDDVQRFLDRLNGSEGTDFRLPTEAEWEYACRAGSSAAYCFGAVEARLAEFGWYAENSDGQTHAVGQKKPNAWGLYDMHGNVTEWCQDWASVYDPGGAVDPTGPEWGTRRVGRGGSFAVVSEKCRAADRSAADPANRGADLGFRVCRW